MVAVRPIDPIDTGDEDVAFIQLAHGPAGSPEAVQSTHANLDANAKAMFIGANVDLDGDVMSAGFPGSATWA